ncbi:MAG: alpha/beta fold hydrolase [Myxococcales bacterium]|nr:alpha/beta fold hydrolase [Myxococcales bacterium]
MLRPVTFFSEGHRLAAHLRLPDDLKPGERRPAVICCQGFSLVKEVWLPKHAEAMNRAGYITLHLDYRYFGESEGQPRCRLVPRAQVEDVRNALTFLETVPEVDASRLALFGVSLGGSVAAGVAGLDDRVKALIAVACPSDLERVWSAFPDFAKFRAKVNAARQKYVSTGEATHVAVPRILSSDPETCALLVADQPNFPTWRLEITFESLFDLFEFKPDEVASTIRGAAMFIYPGDDAMIGRSEMMSLYSKAKEPKKLVMLEGLKHHHVYKDPRGFEAVMTPTLAWLSQWVPVERR